MSLGVLNILRHLQGSAKLWPVALLMKALSAATLPFPVLIMECL